MPDDAVSDDELVAAIEAALAAGERDLCAGGVPPEVIAGRVALSEKHVRKRCKGLVEQDRLMTVDGVDPSTWRARTGYLPRRDD